MVQRVIENIFNKNSTVVYKNLQRYNFFFFFINQYLWKLHKTTFGFVNSLS